MTQATHVNPQVENPSFEEQLEMPAWLEAIFPWSVSTMGHVGLALIIAFVLYLSIRPVIDDTEKPFVLTPMPLEGEVLSMDKSLGTGEDMNLRAQQNLKFNDKQGWSPIEGSSDAASMLEGSSGENLLDMIAIGNNGGIGDGKDGTGKGGGPLAIYGIPTKGGMGKGFFDLRTSGKPRKIVYILDHSGSMLDTFDYLRQEAIRSVRELSAAQSFSVVMFSEQATPIFPQLQRATADAKIEFASKLNGFRAQGKNDDELEPFLKAFEAAFAMQPEVIYFLCDGRFDPRLTDLVSNQLNKSKKVRINTLMYVSMDPLCEEQLKAIAHKNNGLYKFVSEKDLGK